MSSFYLKEIDNYVSVVEHGSLSGVNTYYFLRNPDDPGYYLCFDSEKEAKKYLNAKIKKKHVHPDWKTPNYNQARLFK
jgi:hypothetical protein